MGVDLTGLGASEEAALEARLLLRLYQFLNSSKQWRQVRETGARGLNLASWSRGAANVEWKSQKMLPHFLQWWRRVKYLKVRLQVGSSQTED